MVASHISSDRSRCLLELALPVGRVRLSSNPEKALNPAQVSLFSANTGVFQSGFIAGLIHPMGLVKPGWNGYKTFVKASIL